MFKNISQFKSGHPVFHSRIQESLKQLTLEKIYGLMNVITSFSFLSNGSFINLVDLVWGRGFVKYPYYYIIFI